MTVYLIAFLLLMALAGCGAKEAAEDKIAETVAENTLENAEGGDVVIDGGEMTVTADDGREIILGSGEWPDSELVKSIPEFRDGDITAVMETDDGVWITLESVSSDYAAAYLKTLKNTFDLETFELTTDDEITFGAKNADGISVTYQLNEEILTLALGRDA